MIYKLLNKFNAFVIYTCTNSVTHKRLKLKLMTHKTPLWVLNLKRS